MIPRNMDGQECCGHTLAKDCGVYLCRCFFCHDGASGGSVFYGMAYILAMIGVITEHLNFPS